jgi:hypothetical protein
MGVVEYFEDKGIPDKVYLTAAISGDTFYLYQIVDMGEMWITNPSLVEKGDDYVTIELEQIKFEDTK